MARIHPRRSRSGRLLLGILVVAVVSGCAVGPNYQRPTVLVPESARGHVGPAEAASLADLPWWEVFRDPVLGELVGEAIRANHDLRAAVARIERSRQLIGVARADLLPQVEAQGDAARQRALLLPGAPNQTFNTFFGAFAVAWEIDLWGRIRRATEAAEADYVGAEAFRRGVLLTLSSDVAQTYFELLGLDRELEIARVSTNSFGRTLELFTRQFEGGVGTRLEVSRGGAALARAAATVPDLERAIVAKENQLSILLAREPGPIVRGAPLAEQTTPPDVPEGLPLQLLERRPDVLEAEQAVVAANAEIGVAVGAFLPRVGLSALFGGQSSEIEDVVKGPGKAWDIAASLTGPIFQGGRLLSNYRAAKAGWEQTVEQYRATALNAFAEVSNTMASQEKLKTIRAEQEREVAALREAVDVSLERYLQGISTYFEVLEAQQQLFPAEAALARTTREQLTIVVVFYRALGGGWNLDADRWQPGAASQPPAGGAVP